MLLVPEAAGPHDPLAVTAARVPGSVRRTSSIDTTRPDGVRGDAEVEARARDLLTDAAGGTEVVAEVTVRARIGAGRELLRIDAHPAVPALARLVGATVGPGFRSRVDEAVPDERDRASLLYLLLDDLPGASLVSGYAVQRAGGFEEMVAGGAGGGPHGGDALAAMFADDICAGWASDATLMTGVREHGTVPVAIGPPAPVLDPPDDPLSWHDLGALPAHGMRRRRLLDLVAPSLGERRHPVGAHFRDSHVDEEGRESVLHEYIVEATVDAAARRVVAASAQPRVLPWFECPGAVASAGRLAGMDLVSLRRQVRRELVGHTTCTHLNDTLRSLADVPALLDVLATGGR